MDEQKTKTAGRRFNDFLGKFIPEVRWNTLSADTFEQVIERLKGLDRTGVEDDIMAFIEKKKYKIGTLTQANSGAGWTIFGNITIRPENLNECLSPYVLSLILHEIFHIKRQTVSMRLSMQGELDAWQYQCRIYPLLNPGHEIGEVYAGKSQQWQELCSLSRNSRENLERARDLMIEIAPGYRAYALPIYPLLQEIGYFLKRGDFQGIIAAMQHLAKGARGEKIGRNTPGSG